MLTNTNGNPQHMQRAVKMNSVDQAINQKMLERQAHLVAIQKLDQELQELASQRIISEPSASDSNQNSIESSFNSDLPTNGRLLFSKETQSDRPDDSNLIPLPADTEKDMLDLFTETDLEKFRENAYANSMLAQLLQPEYEPVMSSIPAADEADLIMSPFEFQQVEEHLPHLFDEPHISINDLAPSLTLISASMDKSAAILADTSSNSTAGTAAKGKRGPYKKRKTTEHVCEQCHTTESPVWRCKSYGRIMCNSCCLWMKRNFKEGKGWTCEKPKKG